MKNLEKFAVVALLVLSTIAPGVSFALDEDDNDFYKPNQSPYRVNLFLDIGIITVGAALTSIPRIMVNEGEGPWCGL